MAACNYLDGENIAPRTAEQARKLIGKRVEYLRKSDIDHSGRGYYWPRRGTITDVHGRNLAFESNWYALSDFVEMRLLPTTEAPADE